MRFTETNEDMLSQKYTFVNSFLQYFKPIFLDILYIYIPTIVANVP